MRRTLPTGAALDYTYDAADRIVAVVAVHRRRVGYATPATSARPREILDPEGGVTRMTVQGGLVREVIDPDGVALRFEFDDAATSSRRSTPTATSPGSNATRPGA